jgi:hypothetical protein
VQLCWETKERIREGDASPLGGRRGAERRKMTNRRNVMDGKVIKSLNAREL